MRRGARDQALERYARAEPPAPEPPPLTPEPIVLGGVDFAFDSAGLDPASAVVLGVVAETLGGRPNTRLRVEGTPTRSGLTPTTRSSRSDVPSR